MADFAHLEKMGRELKCPICLSLLNSAASLTCNHVFCNGCLTKSMKADSHCPVCKVPYRRREIRPAPHMDNLVSIYKNMEAASGVNIHVTQNAVSTKDAAGNNEIENKTDTEKSDAAQLSHGKSKKKRKFKNVSKELEMTIEEPSDPQMSVKPSFPAKKRVHVPKHFSTETPTRLSKYGEKKSGKEVRKGSSDGSNVLKEKPSFTARGEPVFSPFFWIRDREEGENDELERLSSQTTENYCATYTPPPKFSFNDINNTNDASPIKVTGPEKKDTESKVADVIDSEMFEWTQRACSPELCTTPVKNKVVSQKESKKSQEKNEEASQYFTPPGRDELVSENMKDGRGCPKGDLYCHKAKDTKSSKGRSKSNKSGKCKRKQDALSVNNAHDSAEGPHQRSHPDTVQKTEKKKKKATFDTSDPNKSTEAALQTHEEEIQNRSSENVKLDSSKTMKKSRKSKTSNPTGQNQQHDDPSTVKVLKEVSVNHEERNKNVKAQSSVSSHQRNTSKNLECIVKGFLDGGVLKRCTTSATKKTQTLTTIDTKRAPEKTDINPIQPSNNVSTVTKDMSIRKCENAPSEFSCVFCHSSKESVASGKMMHYSNGKSVAPNFHAEHSVIHAHRNCTEWAPNVYFDDETAINLESEVARSKKIKCSLCGIKGAALGCFEKSCRKSFHVPCAKLVQQCRWDTDNFVMLCPLHPSSKLPKELPGSQPKKRKQSIPKRDTQSLKADEVTHQSAIAKTLWKGPSNKWVLCCSGLANTEKEIVSEFVKLAGLTLSTTYVSNVTHIIASTDENGACRRTLKFLLGILEGKWILKIDWVKACIESMKPVCEEKYEINVDIRGIRDGPRLGRLRVLNKEPKLFQGCNFYFFGEFLPSYKGYLQDMVVAAGGTMLQRKPISRSVSECSSSPRTFIIYNADTNENHDFELDAKALADTTGSKVAAHTWILDSIAACKMQAL